MRLTQPPPRRDQEVALIPLINVVFLLLIFFMIVGTIAPTDALPIDPPVSRQGQATEPDPVQLLIDADGRIALNGEVIPADQLTSALAESLKSADIPDTPETPLNLTLKADGALVMAELRALLTQLRALGVERVRLLARQD
jgi:biopolymer transport protein ExbD